MLRKEVLQKEGKRKMKHRRSFLTLILSAALFLIPFSLGQEVYAAGSGIDSLTDAQKNSSYGFFVWLSENADTSSERADAEAAVQILTNTVTSANHNLVFNNGNIFGGHGTYDYQDLLDATNFGAQNDATNLDNLRQAINFVTLGNTYRAKESLAPLKISSGMMAMGELSANVQDKSIDLDHPDAFNALENLAYRQIGGTWQYGEVGGGKSDDPYEGWYTLEKSYYDNGNTGSAGHYKVLTDKMGVMLITGFGVRDRFVDETISGYPCVMHDRYYSQFYSTRSGDIPQYNIGTGVTPEKYLSYLDRYTCAVIGHTWNNGTVTRQPTCKVKGVKEFTCTVCGAKKTEDIDYAPHTLTKTPKVNATCTQNGNIEYYTCSVCSKLFSDANGTHEISIGDTVISAQGHRPEVVPGTPATCTQSGKTDGSRCSVCHTVLQEQQTINKLGHDYVTDPSTAIAASCTAPGKDADQKCSRCNDIITGAAVNALGHRYKDVPNSAVAASCTSEGKAADQKCERCGDEVTGAAIPKTPHHWMDDFTEDVPATHSSPGSRSIHCADCGAINEETIQEIPVIEHTYGDWTIDTEAKCEEPGSKHRECTECHYVDTVVIPATDHSWEGAVTTDIEATCTEGGRTSVHCTKCDKVKDVTNTPPLGHLLAKQEGTAPTYEEEGVEDYWICTRCSHMFADVNGSKEIDAPVVIACLKDSIETAGAETEAVFDELAAIEDDIEAVNQDIEAAGKLTGDEAVKASRAALAKAQAAKQAAEAAKAKADAAVEAAQAIVDAAGGDPTALKKAKAALAQAQTAQTQADSVLGEANDSLTAAETQVTDAEEKAAAEPAQQAAAGDRAKAEAAAKAAEAAEFAANGNAYIDPTLPKVKFQKPKAAKKSFTAKWKKLKKKQQKAIKGIEIEYSLTPDFQNPVFKSTGKKKANVKVKKLAPKKTYYVRAHTYVIRDGVKYVSNWSGTRKVKVK